MGLLMNYTPYQKPVLHLHALGSSYKKSLHDDPSESLSILGSLVRTPSLRGRNRSGFVGPLVTGRTASHPSHFGVPYQVDANHRSIQCDRQLCFRNPPRAAPNLNLPWDSKFCLLKIFPHSSKDEVKVEQPCPKKQNRYWSNQRVGHLW